MKSILILDDDSAVRHSFVDYFEDQMWQVFQAESAEDALSLLAEQSSDAAIVDIRLPGMDGHEFIRQACQQHSSMVFVICTGSPEYAVPQDLQVFPRVADHLFKKPVDDLGALEQEVIRLISCIDRQEGSNE